MMYYFTNGFIPWFGFGPFMMIMYWIIMILVCYWGMKFMMGGSCHHSGHQKNHNALDALKTRYAKGEITKEEYERIKKEIK